MVGCGHPSDGVTRWIRLLASSGQSTFSDGHAYIYPLVPETPAIFNEWHRLIRVYGVSGKDAHDARIIAAVKVRGIQHFLTFDTGDFARYTAEGIVIVDPHSL